MCITLKGSLPVVEDSISAHPGLHASLSMVAQLPDGKVWPSSMDGLFAYYGHLWAERTWIEFSPITLAWLDRSSTVITSGAFGAEAPNDRERSIAFGATIGRLLVPTSALEKLDFQCPCWYTICSPQQRHSTGRSPSHHEGVSGSSLQFLPARSSCGSA